jgi:hypothetical protein
MEWPLNEGRALAAYVQPSVRAAVVSAELAKRRQEPFLPSSRFPFRITSQNGADLLHLFLHVQVCVDGAREHGPE